jgi:hypothetical protein
MMLLAQYADTAARRDRSSSLKRTDPGYLTRVG